MLKAQVEQLQQAASGAMPPRNAREGNRNGFIQGRITEIRDLPNDEGAWADHAFVERAVESIYQLAAELARVDRALVAEDTHQNAVSKLASLATVLAARYPHLVEADKLLARVAQRYMTDEKLGPETLGDLLLASGEIIRRFSGRA